jgi:hypothetical protein
LLFTIFEPGPQGIFASRVDSIQRVQKHLVGMVGRGEVRTMMAKIGWILTAVLVLIGSNGFASGVEVKPLKIGGIEYQVESILSGSDAEIEASLKAIDLKNSVEVWRVRLYHGTSRPDWAGGTKNPKVVSLDGFAKGIVAKTDDGATFLIDLETRKAELVRDMRRTEARCPVHHRLWEGVLVPIHYGLVRQPLAGRKVIQGGCCVMPEKSAIVDFCPDCR